MSSVTSELFEGQAGEWRWRFRHRNENIIADSGEGDETRSGARDAIDSLGENAPATETAE